MQGTLQKFSKTLEFECDVLKIAKNNLTYDELNVSGLEGYHHSYNQNKGLNFDTGLLQNPTGNSTVGIQFSDSGFETSQTVRGTFGLGGAEMDESVNRDVHHVVTTETKELGGANIDAVINPEWIVGGERQKRNEDGSLKYDHLGRPVMEDVNGLEAIASDITSVANVHRDLYSGARDFNRLVGAQLRDIQDMLRPEPSEAEQSMLELDISHVEEEMLAIGFDRRGNDSDMAIGPSRAITHPEIFFDDAATNEAMGDYVQSVPAVYYDVGALATTAFPVVSLAITSLGATKTYLDVKEGNMSTGAGVSSATFDAAAYMIPARSRFNVLRYTLNTGGTLFNAAAERYSEQQSNTQP